MTETPEFRKEAWLAKSSELKSKAVLASIVGPVVGGVGLIIYLKQPALAITGGVGPGVSVRENTSATRVISGIAAGFGVATTLTIIPLHIGAAKAKRNANLIVTNESTGLLKNSITIQGIGLQVHF